jgi:hypothetical protein
MRAATRNRLPLLLDSAQLGMRLRVPRQAPPNPVAINALTCMRFGFDTQPMAQEWDIKPRGTECRACGTPFEDGQPYWAALMRSADGYVRVDRCAGCWGREQAAPYSSWRGVYHSPPPPEEEALRKETAESLLRRLMEENEAEQAGVIFILAIMLERKRTLIERDVQVDEDGGVTRIYEHRKTGETFLVLDPQLQLDQLEHVQMAVVAQLGGSRDATGAAGAQEAPAEAVAGEPSAASATDNPLGEHGA